MTPSAPPHVLPDGLVVIAGAGVSGQGAAQMLQAANLPRVSFVLVDDNPEARSDYCEVVSVSNAPLDEATMVVTSPGWRPDNSLLVEAARRGLEVIGDLELCWRLDQSGVFGDPRTWLAITGTNGKTTTTAMLESILKAAGLRARAVGNIGVSLGEAISGPERLDVLAAELSSFQLHWAPRFVPAAGAVLNLAEDHIDWHGSFTAYAQAKLAVLKAPHRIAGLENAALREAIAAAGITGVIGFGLHQGTYRIDGDNLVENELVLAPAQGIEPAGPAGQLDALAAAALARTQSVSPEAIAAGLASFQMAAHRGQVVATKRGITCIDNSKATNPHAANAALQGLENIHWFAGGQLKGASIDELVDAHAERLKAVYVMGQDRELIAASVRRHRQIDLIVTDSTDPDQAMAELVAAASERAVAGDILCLAPAGASLDMYRGMGHRGDIFSDTVRRLL